MKKRRYQIREWLFETDISEQQDGRSSESGRRPRKKKIEDVGTVNVL